MLSVGFKTFGCRLNQGESDSAARAFEDAGFRVLPPGDDDEAGDGGSLPGPDLLVVNTCTVTSKAEQKARRILRLALRGNPRAVVIVTGCYAELGSDEIASLGERILVVPGSRKGVLERFPEAFASELGPGGDPLAAAAAALASLASADADPFALGKGEAPHRARSLLKVEDGCDRACAYCRVRIARGRPVSLDADEAVRRARKAAEGGRAEIVLTGVNLSRYSGCEGGFSGLLRRLVAETEGVSFRISSFEPEGIDADFIEAASSPRVRPFFHLPVQSGSPAVLARMGRSPDAEAILRAVAGLQRAKGDPFISLDMMTGFPGETDAEFGESLAFARAVSPAWIHVFVFSPRPGTAAVRMRPLVPERVAVERAAELSRLAREGKAAYAGRWIGREVAAVIERPGGAGEDRAEAFTENALRVSLAAGLPLSGSAGKGIRIRLRPSGDPSYDAEGEAAAGTGPVPDPGAARSGEAAAGSAL